MTMLKAFSIGHKSNSEAVKRLPLGPKNQFRQRPRLKDGKNIIVMKPEIIRIWPKRPWKLRLIILLIRLHQLGRPKFLLQNNQPMDQRLKAGRFLRLNKSIGTSMKALASTTPILIRGDTVLDTYHPLSPRTSNSYLTRKPRLKPGTQIFCWIPGMLIDLMSVREACLRLNRVGKSHS